MSYCLSPVCLSPENADDAEFCQCKAKLRLNDRYMALKPIGQGGFGRTFLAVDLAKDEKPLCVIKQFFPNVGIDRDKAAILFREEAERLKQLDEHCQIPDLLDYFEQDEQQYLIQEFVEGRNLEQELTEARFHESQIYQLLNDILPVLQFMHNRQVIHRDIKPANIVRRQADQKLVLVDLGAAKYVTGTALAKTGTVIGSAEYTAPEQIRGRAVFASDIYSLGATCVHLLTQMSPFDLFDTSDDRWVWRDYLINPVSDRLTQILDRMLQNATSRRYQLAAQVLADLRQSMQAIAIPRPKPEAYFLSGTARPLLMRQNTIIPPRIAEDQSIGTLTAAGEVVSIALSPDGKMLVGSSASRKAPDNAVNVWNLQTGEMIHQFQQTAWMNAIAICPDGRALVGGGTNGALNFWSLKTGELMGSIHAHAGQVSSLAICSTGDTLATSGTDGLINLWNLTTGRLIRSLNAQSKRIPAIAISPNRQYFASSNYGATINLWELGTGNKLQTLRGEATHGYSSIAISPNGRIIACGSSASKNGAIHTWDFVDRHLTGSASFDVHLGLVQVVAVSPDGKLLASGSRDMTVKLWNLHTGALIRHFQGHLSPIFSLAFSSNELLVSGDGEGIIKVWALP